MMPGQLIFNTPIGSATKRIYLICYGQSNMDVFCVNNSPVIAPSAGTFYNDGSTIGAADPATSGSGIITCMNSIKATTGLDVCYQNTSSGGTAIDGLTDPTLGPYINLVAFAQFGIQPTDAVFILWDQGEGDAAANPHETPTAYVGLLSILYNQILASIGKSAAKCPFILAGLGTAGGLGDNPPTGGNNQLSWHTLQAGQFNAQYFIPHMIFSHSNVDIVRGDGYHYVDNSGGTPKMGQRFAQAVSTLHGSTSGYAHWEIVSAATVSATQTDLTVQHGIGTDFTPTSGGQGFEVSGDNGANWDSTATAARQNATTIRLTHPSMSTTKARVVRYQYGLNPPSMSANCDLNAFCAGPVNAIYDNSSIAVPLNPTTWDIRPTPTTTIPVPTWRDIETSTPPHQTQSIPIMLLGPPSDNYQKFVILAVSMGQWNATLPSTIKITPNIGAQVTATYCGFSETSLATNTTMFFYQATLGVDANTAISCSLDFTFSTDPFSPCTINLYTVPLADLSSTTSTGHGGNATTSNTVGSCTVNVSAGGFILALVADSASQNNYAVPSSNYAKRWEWNTGFSADASNCSASATSNLTVTNAVSGDIDILMASWR